MSGVSHTISRHEKFLFDLNGFLVVKNVFTAEEVAAANAAVDAQAAQMRPRKSDALRNTKAGTPLAATGPRIDMGGMLWWDDERADLFRNMLMHPKLVPYYTALVRIASSCSALLFRRRSSSTSTLSSPYCSFAHLWSSSPPVALTPLLLAPSHLQCGEGYRMDHQPLLVAQEANSEGFSLHGGPISGGGEDASDGRFNPELQYRFVNGEMWTSLLAASVQLCDHNPGDGGFCVVRGSHKLNLPVPSDFANGVSADFKEHVYQPATKAGDVVIWSEATVHGATPWLGERQRRVAIYRFAPANMGYGRGYLDVPESSLARLTELQRAVVEPPYAVRLERPLVTPDALAGGVDGRATKRPRSEAKKEHDRQTIGTGYF